MNVSRPIGENACVMPRARMPSSTIAQPPSGVPHEVAVAGVLHRP